MHEKPENAQAVVHRNDDYVFLRQVRAVLPRLRCASGHEASAINPNHHGQFLGGSLCWDPDVQRQTIFASSAVTKIHVVVNSPLLAVRTELCRFADPIPFRSRHGWLPSQVTYRRRCVRDSKKRVNCAVLFARDSSGCGFHFKIGRRGERGHSCKQ